MDMDNVVVTVAEPSANIETRRKLFRYPGIHLLVVFTGGEAVVHELASIPTSV